MCIFMIAQKFKYEIKADSIKSLLYFTIILTRL